MNSTNTKNTDSSKKKIEQGKVKEFEANFRGSVLPAGNHGYDQARKIWNAMFDKKPAIIARCVGTSDVIKAVNFARDNDLEVSVKGGDHNSAGTAVCDDGLMIDLSLMRRVTVNQQKKTARVDGGCLLGDVDSETQLYGLAVSAGIVSHTGVGGLALGGGFGWISRKYGLSVDNLISAEMVTAEGQVVTASENENPDLFWALRGGGGNFGVATSFLFRAHPVHTVVGGPMFWNIEDARRVMEWYREFLPQAPEELSVVFGIKTVPPVEPFPEDIHLRRVCALIWCYSGPPECASEAMAAAGKLGAACTRPEVNPEH